MAAATLTNYRSSVFGNERVSQYTAVFANTGDTITFPSMKTIKTLSFTPTTNASFGFTISGKVATLTAGGGLTGIITAIGS